MKNTHSSLSYSELLARSWKEIKNRFAPFMLLACITPALSWLLLGTAFGFSPLTQHVLQQQHPLISLCIGIFTALTSSYCTAALILFVCKRAETPLQALLVAFRAFVRVVIGGFLFSVLISVSLILLALVLGGTVYILGAPEFLYALILLLLILAGLLTGVYFCLLPYLLILSKQPVFSCFRNAFYLVKGRFWHTFGLLIILGCIITSVAMATGLALGLLLFMFSLVSGTLAGILNVLWIPITGLLTLLFQIPLLALYLDRNTIKQSQRETTEEQ